VKLIVAPLDALQGYVSREFYEVLSELITHHGWEHLDANELWGRSPEGMRDHLLRRFDRLPRVALFWEGYSFFAHHPRALNELDCRKCIYVDDLHSRDAMTTARKVVSFLACDLICSTYQNVFGDFFPRILERRRVVWVPHCATPQFRLPFNENAENAIFLSGAVNSRYPLRERLQELRETTTLPIVYHRHPGYHCGYDHSTSADVGGGYARKLRRYRVGFTDCLRFRYLVAKHFEVPATGALLLADRAASEGLRALGFLEDVHYVATTSRDLEDKIRYLLDGARHPDLDQIRRRGQALVWERHMVGDRARLLDQVCCEGLQPLDRRPTRC